MVRTLLEKIAEFSNYAGLSDVHLHANHPTYLRADGQIRALPGDSVSAEALWQLAEHCMVPELKRRWLDEKSVDFSIECDGYRYRANFYFESGQPAAALRRLPKAVPSLEELGMSPAVNAALTASNGLILITGATGSGKSTSLAAMVNHILDIRAVHLLTIEDPVEFFFRSRCSLISQREIGVDVPSFSSALRAAFREDPDVILIGEIRDPETIALALTIAETGHLVLATLHTSSCAGAIDRIVDVFPSRSRDQTRVQLAGSLRLVVNQRLLERIDGNGRIPAFEVLSVTDAVRNLIRENKSYQLQNVIDTARAQGMISMRAALESLCASGLIDRACVDAELANAKTGAEV